MSAGDKDRGLYSKYRVERLNDPEGKHEECDFFVLDLTHDPFALPAIRAYIDACRKEYPHLAVDLMDKWSRILINRGK